MIFLFVFEVTKLKCVYYDWYFNVFFPSVFQHPFVTQPLNRSLAIELLDKMNNPDHSTYHDFDDDDPEVGIRFNHRISLSFCLPTKLIDWILNYFLLSHRNVISEWSAGFCSLLFILLFHV